MAAKQFDVGEQYHHFLIDGKPYQAGQYDYEFVGDDMIIWNVVGGNRNKPVIKTPWATIINGATGLAFGSKAAIITWLRANFFF